MKAPINIDKYSQDGHLIESHKSVPPGISNIPTGPYHGDIIETPADGYQTGGFVDRKQTGGFKYIPSEAEAEQSDNTRINIPGLPQQRITPIKPNMPGYDAHFGKTYEIHKNTASADISKAKNYEREGTVSQTPPSVFDFIDNRQTFNVSAGGPKGASETSYNPIQRFKNNLAENLYPYNYDNSISQVWDAGVLGNPSAFRDPSMSDNQDYGGYQEGEDSYRDERIDLLHMLMGKEQITNSIEESIYKPTDSENKDAKYYRSKTTERDIVMDLYRANGSAYPPYEGDTTTLIDLINKIPSEKGKSKHVHNNILNTYQLSRGEDKKGSYIAYYDEWDVNPFKKYNKTLGDLSDFVTEDILKLTPPEIYGRIYYDKKTGEFLNTEKLNKKQYGGDKEDTEYMDKFPTEKEQRKKAEGILNNRNYQKQTKSNPYFKHNLQTGGVRKYGKVVRKQKGGLKKHEVSNWSSEELKEHLGKKAWGKIQRAMREYPMDVDYNAKNIERYAYLNDPDDVDYDPERYIEKTTPKMGRSLDILKAYRLDPDDEAYGEDIESRVANELKFAPYNDIKLYQPKKLPLQTISKAREPKELQESNVSMPKPKYPTQRVMKYSNKVRTNQIPSHDMVWNNKKNKYVKRNVEKEEVDRYKKENRFRTPTRIKANFKTGGTKYPSKKK